MWAAYASVPRACLILSRCTYTYTMASEYYLPGSFCALPHMMRAWPERRAFPWAQTVPEGRSILKSLTHYFLKTRHIKFKPLYKLLPEVAPLSPNYFHLHHHKPKGNTSIFLCRVLRFLWRNK